MENELVLEDLVAVLLEHATERVPLRTFGGRQVAIERDAEGRLDVAEDELRVAEARALVLDSRALALGSLARVVLLDELEGHAEHREAGDELEAEGADGREAVGGAEREDAKRRGHGEAPGQGGQRR